MRLNSGMLIACVTLDCSKAIERKFMNKENEVKEIDLADLETISETNSSETYGAG